MITWRTVFKNGAPKFLPCAIGAAKIQARIVPVLCFKYPQIQQIQRVISLTRENLEALNNEFGRHQHPPSMYIQVCTFFNQRAEVLTANKPCNFQRFLCVACKELLFAKYVHVCSQRKCNFCLQIRRISMMSFCALLMILLL